MSPRFLRALMGGLALLSLCACLAVPILYFLGRVSEQGYKTGFLVASIGWFVFAIARGAVGRGGDASGPGSPPSL
jgi:hypothetical protein